MGRSRRSVLITLVLTCASGASNASASEPSLIGLYRVGGLGLVDVTVSEGRVVGRLKAAEECPELALEAPVLQGAFEGSLFVGTVTVCQTGPSGSACVPQKAYPFLGFWTEEQLVGTVRLDPGCTSPALDAGALRVSSATAEDRQKLLGGGEGSAETIAKQVPPARTVEAAITEGMRLVKEGKSAEALAILRPAQGSDPDNVSVLYLTGVAYSGLGQAKDAVEPFRRAAELGRTRKLTPSLVGKIHFELARALAQEKRGKEAIAALNQGFDYAGESGFTLDDLQKNPDLAPIRREREFQALTARVRLAPGKPRGKAPR